MQQGAVPFTGTAPCLILFFLYLSVFHADGLKIRSCKYAHDIPTSRFRDQSVVSSFCCSKVLRYSEGDKPNWAENFLAK